MNKEIDYHEMVKHLSPEDACIIRELSPKLDIAFAKRLSKAHEQKFYIETTKGEKRLLRIWDAEPCAWFDNDTSMYEYVASSGINISQPISAEPFREGAIPYQLFTWLEGEDLIDALPRMTQAEQFSTGVNAGVLMRKLHALLPDQDHEVESWKIRFGRNVQRIIQSYSEKHSISPGVDLLVRYLRDNQNWLDNRPQTFTHGDWNTENLIFTPDSQIGIIDLSGDKDYGDPWWEFRLIPHDLNQSAHFYTGQIRGYFEGEPPLGFFQLLSYYTAYSTLAFLSDSAEDSDPENVKFILNWFDDMRNPVPKWYFSQV